MVKKFLHKILPVISVVLILLCCIVPARAADIGNGSLLYALVPFNEVRLFEAVDQIATLPWGGSIYYANGSRPNYTASVGNFGYSISEIRYADDLLTFEVATSSQLSGLGTFQLYGREFVITSRMLREGVSSFTFGLDGDGYAAVSVSVTVSAIQLVGNRYVVEDKTFSVYERAEPGWDLIDCLRRIIIDTKFISGDYVFVKELAVSFSEFTSDSNIFSMTQSAITSFPRYQAWLNQYNLSNVTEIVYDGANPEGVDFVSWLGVAAGSFLEFELWPGFSFGQILRTIMVIGLLFWFLKLTF